MPRSHVNRAGHHIEPLDRLAQRISGRTGECFTDPTLSLRTYRTRVVGGMIEVELQG